jgi:hypothetical protein
MTGISFALSVVSSGISLGCIVLSGRALYDALFGKEHDEAQTLSVFVSSLMALFAVIFGIHTCPESWVVVGVVAVAGGLLCSVRTLLEQEGC